MSQVVIRMDVAEFIVILVITLISFLVLIVFLFRSYLHLRRQQVAILSKMPLGVIVLNAAGKQIFINDLARLLVERVDPKVVEQASRYVEGEAQGTSILQNHDGSLIQIQFQALGNNRRNLLLTLQDMSFQHEAQTNQRKFIHTLSHELLTPFTSLQLRLATLESV